MRTLLAIGTYGNVSSTRRPMAYIGRCGPGTFVVTVFTLRCGHRAATRVPSASIIGGAKPAIDTSDSPATACRDAFRSCIGAAIAPSRLPGSGSPTGKRLGAIAAQMQDLKASRQAVA